MSDNQGADVISINQKRYFTLPEAQKLMPIIRRITLEAQKKVQTLNLLLERTKDENKRREIEVNTKQVFQTWYEKIQKLGCESKGMWLVDFDSGEGYYCWHYPEVELGHFHGYFEGFQGRVKIQ